MMLKEGDKQLLLDFSLDLITLGELRTGFGAELSASNLLLILSQILENKDGVLLRSINSFFFKTSFIPESCEFYNQLLIEEWHKQHDDIANILQFNIKCPSSTAYFKKSIELKFSYLFHSDDYEPYITKCMWGIAKNKSAYSKEVLLAFSKSENEIIRTAALYQLDRLGLN